MNFITVCLSSKQMAESLNPINVQNPTPHLYSLNDQLIYLRIKVSTEHKLTMSLKNQQFIYATTRTMQDFFL